MTAPSGAPRVAVALAWERGSAAPPQVVAKGRGAVAEKILAVARENGIAVEGDPMLVAILSEIELEEHIPEELFKAVAEVLAFVLGLRRRPGDGLVAPPPA